MKAAVYVRVSTEDQRSGTSLASQTAWCLAEADRLGYEVAETYEDASSGSNTDRPAWRRLMADARAGKFAAVFAWDLDRLHRDLLNGLQALRDLSALGVAVHDSKTTGDATSADNQLMTGFRLLLAQEERRKILERTVRGQRSRARSGWPGGKPPYGWKLEGHGANAHPVPDEQAREVLHRIRRLVVRERLTTGQVVARLVADEVPPPAVRWSPVALRRMLQREEYVTARVTWGKVSGNGRKTKAGPDGKPVFGEPVELNLGNPVFTPEQWDDLQAVLKAHPLHGRRVEEVTQMLSGRVVFPCGEHGTGFRVQPRPVYRCHGNRRQPRCGDSQLRCDVLDEYVWGEVCGLLGDPERLEALAREWLAVSEEGEQDDSEFQALTRQVAKLERAMGRAQELFLLSDDEESAREAVARVRGQLDDARTQLAAQTRARQDARSRAQQIRDLGALAEQARERLATMPTEQRREVVLLLDLWVHVDGPVVDSVPAAVTVRGSVDPRILQDRSPEGGASVFAGMPFST